MTGKPEIFQNGKARLGEESGLLTKPGVAVEKVRDRNVFLAGIIAAVAFFFSPQLKWQLPQLLVG